MSQTVWLLRLWSGFRYGEDQTIHQIQTNQRAFRSLSDAERYAQDNPPVTLNPFVGLYDDGESCELSDGSSVPKGEAWISLIYTTGEGQEDDYARDINLDQLREFAVRHGVNTPDPSDKDYGRGETWRQWWDTTAPAMTDDQKRALWLYILPKPYQIVEVDMEE